MDYESCVDRDLLISITKDDALVFQTLKVAEDDLEESKECIDNGKYLWGTIQLYSSMLNYARALLLRDGIQEKSHYCAVEYLRKHHDEELGTSIDTLDAMRQERHMTLYDSAETISHSMAIERLEWVKEFRQKVLKLLKSD